MGVRPSRHVKPFEGIPLLTEMQQLPSNDRPSPTPHAVPSATHGSSAPAALDYPHQSNFTFYKSAVPPRHARSRKLSKLRRIMLCGGGSSGSSDGGGGSWRARRRGGRKGMGQVTRGLRDDEDNFSVADSFASETESLKSGSSAIVSILHRPKGAAQPFRECELKKRRVLDDE
ncbi:hypothetical protein GTA08_BOTSDO07688 [Neofusicoccum parvum]|uniref:Uncharacterized protein n=1 Tax=Neofusicoccum parvum TaxID=310453 RepID=A0ACB5S8H2_9PEZI|nr:hypothetical protein GTA08_BOTSDO07688 [Neofusicoccum parvum]